MQTYTSIRPEPIFLWCWILQPVEITRRDGSVAVVLKKLLPSTIAYCDVFPALPG